MLDCNMGNQGLAADMDDASIEHSAMLAFAGKVFTHLAYPGKKIYVAFQDVELHNVSTTRGGYADDIWISRGGFRPNILNFVVSNLHSANRINSKRATLSFSGLAQNVQISDADIHQLHAEDTGELWGQLPPKLPVSTRQGAP